MGWLVGFVALLAGCDLALGLPKPDPALEADARNSSDAKPIDAPIMKMDAPPVLVSCKDALDHGVTSDGVQMIDPDGSGPNAPFQVYCDMTTAGGGWTLVYSYTFNNYASFMANNNAVTPRPDWGYPASSGTTVSTTIPTSPSTTTGAMPFLRWRTIGTEWLVTSTINNWVRCTPGTGSLVTLTGGSITCSVERVVVNTCILAPYNVGVGGTANANGPSLNARNFYYYFDGSTAANWPTHDPCGTNSPNQLDGVADPRGAIYVR
jgi:hypothetical protein